MRRTLLAIVLAAAVISVASACAAAEPTAAPTSASAPECSALITAGNTYWDAQTELITSQRVSLGSALAGKPNQEATDRTTLANVANQKASQEWTLRRDADGARCHELASAALQVQAALLTALTTNPNASPDALAAVDQAAAEARARWDELTQ